MNLITKFFILMAIISSPWLLSLGTYFNGYAHHKGEQHHIYISAKSGFYRAHHVQDDQIYRSNIGIYASFGDVLYFFTLYGEYLDSLPPELAEEVLEQDWEHYFRGVTRLNLIKQEKRYIGVLEQSGEPQTYDRIEFNGRVKPW
ncbi:hypothetical protein K6U21_05260 [Vibrio vulnificus]|uniref:hypothetical protein n=1 Tax=Vibrio vulnificus TaxID=672 RepID=UPI001EEBDC47|nr:hypothetical protein [Vibrio vulnificus]MCG6303602.1 hypothetical protein [Vibrio vulnificus]